MHTAGSEKDGAMGNWWGSCRRRGVRAGLVGRLEGFRVSPHRGGRDVAHRRSRRGSRERVNACVMPPERMYLACMRPRTRTQAGRLPVSRVVRGVSCILIFSVQQDQRARALTHDDVFWAPSHHSFPEFNEPLPRNLRRKPLHLS